MLYTQKSLHAQTIARIIQMTNRSNNRERQPGEAFRLSSREMFYRLSIISPDIIEISLRTPCCKQNEQRVAVDRWLKAKVATGNLIY